MNSKLGKVVLIGMFVGLCFGGGAFAQESGGETADNRPVMSVEALEVAAESGDAKALWTLMYYYVNGYQVEKNPRKATGYLFDLVKMGDEPALIMRRVLGLENIDNPLKGPDMFNDLVKSGNVMGLFWQGQSYHYGLGVGVDISKATDLFKKAIEMGSRPSLYELGMIYYKEALGSTDSESEVSSLAYKYLIAYLSYYPELENLYRIATPYTESSHGLIDECISKISGKWSKAFLDKNKTVTDDFIEQFGKVYQAFGEQSQQ